MDPERLTPEDAARAIEEMLREHAETMAARRKQGFDEWLRGLALDGLKHRRSRKGGRAQSVSDTELVNAYRMFQHTRGLGRETRKPIYRRVARALGVSYSTVAKRLPALLRQREQT